jgi:hypothetical protein
MDASMSYSAGDAHKTDDLHREAIERYELAVNSDRDNREDAADDLAFLIGDQWPIDIRQAREAEGRPVITINRLPQFLRQVTGDIRRINPALSVIAGDNEASNEVAEVVDGLVRQIQYACDAPSVYERAAEQAAACGMGWFRILTDYEADDSFDQEIKIESIMNPFSVYVDPNSKAPSRSDAEYMFVIEHMPRKDFERAYPKARAVDMADQTYGDALRHWADGDKVVIAEYWHRDPVVKTIAKLSNGRTIPAPDGAKVGQFRVDSDGQIVSVQAIRKVDTHRVMMCKMSGAEIIEGPTEWPGKYFPIVGVMGEELHVGERVVRSSVIRSAKDPQRLYNYARSQNAEVISLQPKAPYIGTLEQFAGHETIWANANKSSASYLPYNSDPDAPGAPQRSQPPMASQGLANEIALAAEDMQATTGIYNAALGQRSNEKSGVAIEARKMESDISTSIYVDNLSKAIWQTGRIIVDLIPTIYDAQRVVRIIGKDEEESAVGVNGMQIEGGEDKPVNDLTIGRYDVRVKTGPSYSSARSAAGDAMLQFIQAVPAAGAVAGDLIAKTQDWPGADQLADRLKKMLPPGMADDEEGPEAEQAAQMAQAQQEQQMQMQQQAAQMAQQMQQLELRIQAAKATEAEADAVKAQADAQKAQFDAQAAQRADAVEAGAVTQAIGEGVARIVGPF